MILKKVFLTVFGFSIAFMLHIKLQLENCAIETITIVIGNITIGIGIITIGKDIGNIITIGKSISLT